MIDPANALESPARYRWLLAAFTRREVMNRYAGSVSGLAWTLLHPLAQLAIFAFVFSQVFRAGVPAEFASVNYTSFVAVALWPWIMFSEALSRGSSAVTANAGLIRKVAFPHRLLVYSTVLAGYCVHLVGFLVVLVVLRAMGEGIHLSTIPVALVLLLPYLAFATGLAAFLAALQALMRDVEHGIGIALTIGFYATPILYPASILPEGVRAWVQASPPAYFSQRMREVLIQGSGFAVGDLVAAAICLAVFFLGLWFFNRLAPHFEDFV
ncbi:hypothetical protein BWI17_08080 [Betaproteobacteria bacterium GR16-43]|nr:hypothetical protein BWI17_08080 [Betaproteobacteria bacterium GR16-43]